MTIKFADTIGDMFSDLASRRIVAEYNQLVIRIEKLEQYIDTLTSEYSEEYIVLMRQLYCMISYREALVAHINYMNKQRQYKGQFKFLESGCVTLKTR